MRLLPPILANLLCFVAFLGFGSLLLRFLPKTLSRIDRFASMALGGIGLLGAALFLVGLVSFCRTVILVILISGAILGFWQLYREAVDTGISLRPRGIPIVPAVVVAAVLLITFIGGLPEPVGDIRMDVIAYHFLGPSVWLRDGAIHVLPDECHASFPATVETVYAALTAVGGTRAPELFACVSMTLLLLVSYGFAIRLGLDARGAWWAIALIAAMPVVYRGAYGGFLDAIFSSFILLSLRFALDAVELREFGMAGLFSGFAMGTKYTGLPAFIVILAVAAALALVRQFERPARHLVGFLLMAATACAVASPWYLRNWISLGSPIYPPPPLLLHFFHIKYMSPQTIDALAALIRKEGLGMGHSLSSFILLPFHLTFHPANFLNGPGGVGVSLLALAPFGFLLRWRDPFVGALGLFSFMQVLGWFVTEQEARFLIHVYILLAIFAVWGWREVAAQSPRMGRGLSAAAIALSILYGLVLIASERMADLHAAVSPRFEQRRRTEEIPYLASFTYLNTNPSVKKVLVLEPRVPTFYLRKDYLKPVGRFGEQTIPEGNDFRLLAGKLSAYGITHVLDVRLDTEDIHQGFRIPVGQPDLQLVFQCDDQRVYKVSSQR